jgi:cytochrome c2
MPDYELSTLEATDLAAFLATRTDTVRFSERVLRDSPMTAKDASTGRSLARDYTCRGCHVLGGDGNRVGPTLDGVGARLQPAYIYAFLKDPQAIVPGTAMKDFDLWDEEARALTAYFTLGNSESMQSDASGGDDQGEKGSR